MSASRGLCANPAHFGAYMPDDLASSPPSPTAGAGAQKRSKAKQTPETDAQQRSRRKARQSTSREHELIWLLQQRLRAVSWPHWRLRCMQSLHGHGMGVSDFDHSHAATPQRVTRASCAQHLRYVLGAACR